MALINETLFGVEDKVKIAIERIKNFEPEEGYYVAFSGGKDSQTVYHLCLEAGVKFDAHYNLTTVDPPELVQFIKQNYHDVIIDKPKLTMWQLIEKKGLPTRLSRFCCEHLKERGGEGRFVITGVRKSESPRRKDWATVTLNAQTKKQIKLMNDNDESRRMVENCFMKTKHILNPIIDWEDNDVWDYLNSRNIKHCILYDNGFKRIGCIGCPMSYNQLKELEQYPKYYQAYSRSIEKLIEKRIAKGVFRWKSAEEAMRWWLYDSPIKDENQFELFEEEGEDE